MMYTLKQIINQVNEYMDSNTNWTKKELDKMFELAEDTWELEMYKMALIEAASRVIIKQLKKKAKDNQSSKDISIVDEDLKLTVTYKGDRHD